MISVAINGYGRIGRNILRALYEGGYREQIKIVAINDLGGAETNAHLTKYDTTHGIFEKNVSFHDGEIRVDGDVVRVFAERDPAKLPWNELGVDIVFECTGRFTDKEASFKHIQAGAKRVIISAPSRNADATVVYGVNDHLLSVNDIIISNASCTTNCLAPIAKVLNDSLVIESGIMTTIHSYTNDQSLLDLYHIDLRRARAAPQSMIPAETGAAEAVGLVLPELRGKFKGMAVRVPTPNVSLVDFTFSSSVSASVEEVNRVIREAASSDCLKGVLRYSDKPLVSQDYSHCPASSVFDATLTQVVGRMIKVMAWYDNEWGFSNRMLDNALVLAKLEQS